MRSRLKPTTAAIRAWRALERSPDDQWVEWAISRLEAGDDSDHLEMLAGLTAPFDYFEIVRIADTALRELNIGVRDAHKAVDEYVGELVRDLLANEQPLESILDELRTLCIETDYGFGLMPFYSLCYAKEDLATEDFQYYWKGATRENIDDLVRAEGAKWPNRGEDAV